MEAVHAFTGLVETQWKISFIQVGTFKNVGKHVQFFRIFVLLACGNRNHVLFDVLVKLVKF